MTKWQKRFPDDLMMQELHKIREKIQRETKGMTAQQFNEYCEKKIKTDKARTDQRKAS